MSDRFPLTGNPQIDEDHRKIFYLYDRYLEAHEKSDISGIKEVFYELLEYLTFHFIREEELMTNISFPDLSDHRHTHFQLQEIYLSLVQPVLSGKETNAEVPKFMELMKFHIEKVDSKIADFIKEQNK